MDANAGNQFDLVWQFHQVIVCPRLEQLCFRGRFFGGRKNNHRGLGRGRLLAELPYQIKSINARHDQVLQNHRWLKLLCRFLGFVCLGAKKVADIRLVGEEPPNGLADHGLVVNQEHTMPFE